MSLIAGKASVLMSPVSPLSCEVFKEKFAKSFTIVTDDAFISICP